MQRYNCQKTRHHSQYSIQCIPVIHAAVDSWLQDTNVSPVMCPDTAAGRQAMLRVGVGRDNGINDGRISCWQITAPWTAAVAAYFDDKASGAVDGSRRHTLTKLCFVLHATCDRHDTATVTVRDQLKEVRSISFFLLVSG